MLELQNLSRLLSRPTAKPYRTRHLTDGSQGPPTLDANGHVAFSPNDVENPKNWTLRRRWYITIVSVLMVVNATFASSGPSGKIALQFLYR